MSTYLELIEKKYALGMLSKYHFEHRKRVYYKKNKKTTEWIDKDALKELNLLTKDKDYYIQTQILSNLTSINHSNKEIKGWITFIGVMMIIGIIVTLAYSFG